MSAGNAVGRFGFLIVGAALASAGLADDGGCPVAQSVRGHENVEWSISYAFHLTDGNRVLPRALLVGDSICNGYQERVRELVEGRCNVSYWISSYCATSPEYLRLLAFHLEAAKYDVIHFNNGLHSLGTDTAAWAKALDAALRLVREKQPQARLVWATSTPLKDAVKTARVRELNAAAVPVVRALGGVETDDLFSLLDPLDREIHWSDAYHHNPSARDLEARQVARFVAPELRAAGVTVNGAPVVDAERRTFADGEAVRYRLPDGARHVTGESTEWSLPEDAWIWFQPEWMGGICYEAPFTNACVGSLRPGLRMAFPVTAKLPDGTYRLLTEANVVDYTDGCAVYRGNGRFGIDYYADTNGFDQAGADTTPWRVMLQAKNLQTLAASDIVRRLCPAPPQDVAAKCASFVRPGRSVWQWLPAGDPVYAEQKDWYDRTRALGFEYYLVDDGWKRWRDGEMDQWACLRRWIDYGKSIGVESFVWVDSKEMLTPEARRAYLDKVKASGAVGIKIDFMPQPSYAMMKWYEETLADTLSQGLMTDFHGCVKPSGRERTWPHEVAREAIRGHEWHITRYRRALPPEHDCILPFNRLVQGHADYTPMVFEKKELNGYTWARELAQGIFFSAPFLCFGDYPKNYLENPAVAIIRALPSVYDETRILPASEIGRCIAVAKRKGADWFVAVENGAEARPIEIALDFLSRGDYDVLSFGDAEDRPDGYAVGRGLKTCTDRFLLALKPCGGFAAWLRRR